MFRILILALLFGSSLIPPTYNDYKLLCWLATVGVIMLYTTTVFFKKKSLTINLLDISILCLVLYNLIHYALFSLFKFDYPFFWVYVGYVLLFYALKCQFQNFPIALKKSIHVLSILKYVALVQVIIVLLQYVNIIASFNTDFAAVGTFATPNLLSQFLSVAVLLIVWEWIYLKKRSLLLNSIDLLIVIACVGINIVNVSRSSWIALILGLCFVIPWSSFKINKKTKIFSAIAGVLLAVFGVLGLYYLKPDSVNGRGFIAKILWQEITKQPWLGYGNFSFFKVYNTAKSNYFLEASRPWGQMQITGNTCCAFNEYLNLWLDIGIIGLLLVLVVIVQIVLKSPLQKPIAKLGIAFLVMLSFWALFSYPTKIPVLFSVGILGAALLESQWQRNAVVTIHKRIPKIILGLASIGIGLVVLVYTTKNTWAIHSFLKKKEMLSVEKNTEKLIEIYKRVDFIKGSKFQLGERLFLLGKKKQGIYYMQQEFNQLPDTDFSKKLAYYYFKTGAHKKTEYFIKYNIGNQPYLFEYRQHLASFYEGTNQRLKAVKAYKDIVLLPEKIPSAKTRAYKAAAEKWLLAYKNSFKESK